MIERGKTLLSFMEVFIVGGKYTTQKYKIKKLKSSRKKKVEQKDKQITSLESSIKERLPEFNIPAKYIFKSELPLTNINKIDFKKLEEEALKYTDSEKIVLSYNINNSKVKVRKI